MPRLMCAGMLCLAGLIIPSLGVTEARADRTIGNYDELSGLYTFTSTTDLNDVPSLAGVIKKFPNDPAPYTNIPFVTTNVNPVLEVSKFFPSDFGPNVTRDSLVRVEVWFSGVIRAGGLNSQATIFTSGTSLLVGIDNPNLVATLPSDDEIPINLSNISWSPITTTGTTTLPVQFQFGGSQPSEPFLGLPPAGNELPQLVYSASDPGGIPDEFFASASGEKLQVPVIASALSRYVSQGTGNGFAIVQTLVSPKLTIRYLFVPEPSSVVLMGLGLAGGLAMAARRGVLNCRAGNDAG